MVEEIVHWARTSSLNFEKSHGLFTSKEMELVKSNFATVSKLKLQHRC